MPLANAFPRVPEEFAAEPRFPLDVCRCGNCGLVQTPDVIDPEVLFREYVYVTGVSEIMNEHHRAYARSLTELLALRTCDLVIEIASNDGSLLRRFGELGVRTLGVEPAANIAERARAEGTETLDVFFDESTAPQVRDYRGPARVVIANNVLAHVDDTVGFLRGCRMLLSPEGVVVIEVPYLRHLIDRLEYDTIYHEHLCYFSVGALLRAFGAAGLAVRRVEHVPVHGGSLRVMACAADGRAEHAPDVTREADRECADGLGDARLYHSFAQRVCEQRAALRGLLESLRASGRRLAAYGAPAKGNTLLNYCGIGTDVLEFTVDRNPLKVGRFTPGMHLPVRPVGELEARRPDFALLLAWNLAEEVFRQQRPYREAGGRFILPIPSPQIV